MSETRIRTTLTQKSELKDLISTIVEAIIIALIIVFFITPVRVVGHSMEPTRTNGQLVFTSRFAEIQRGSIVSINSKALNEFIIKRVIALPGDTIAIENGQTLVNGEPLDESYVVYAVENYNMDEVTVPEDCYFVMGDNRPVSLDSRSSVLSFVPRREITGVEFFAVPTISSLIELVKS